MYSLGVPTPSSIDAYDAAVGTIQKLDRRAPFTKAASIVQARCIAFDQLAADLQFDRAEGPHFDVQGLGQDAMSDLYDLQFAQRIGTKAIRDGIKNAAPYKLCPYCGEGSVAQLDHYLPKRTFAGTAVHPANLVPACGDCNFAKLDYKPGQTAPAVLHPYFDTAFDTAWLSATVKLGRLGVPLVAFEVSLAHSDPKLEARLNAHMGVFKLWERFSVWAAQSLNNFERYLDAVTMTLDGARDHLQRMAVQESGGRVNSWEGAAYEAMLKSDWYLATHLKLL